MASIVAKLDEFETSKEQKQFGENGHAEYRWQSVDRHGQSVDRHGQSVDKHGQPVDEETPLPLDAIQELITQLQFQLVRNADITVLETQLATIIETLTSSRKTPEAVHLLAILYKLLGQTRDIDHGRGEYKLSYMMIVTWHNYFPRLAMFALRSFVTQIDETHKAYGSWKDIKYLCLYVKTKYNTVHHPLIQYAIELMNEQIKRDETSVDGDEPISLAAKWIPRQTSGKFGWLNRMLAEHYFQSYMQTAKTAEIQRKASTKCQTLFRQLISKLNRTLDTIQIKQCKQRWAEIDHAKTTSITLKNQTRALLNITKKGEQRSSDQDRVTCADNFKAYAETQKKEGKELKGSKIGMEQFTVKALDLLSGLNLEDVDQDLAMQNRQLEIDILNSQWRDHGNKNNAKSLGPMIPMVDNSGSMSGDAQHAAVALGCRIAERSSLGKRAISFASKPEWLNLEGCGDFTSMVDAFVNSPVGYSTNFYAALDLILGTIEANRIPSEEVNQMVLVLLSDMQINECIQIEQHATGCAAWSTLYENITKKYAEVGVRLYGEPLTVPHIVFWNLRYTDGFPTLSTQENATMMCGFSSTLLNEFCEVGIEALKQYTPWNAFVKSLQKPEYQVLEDRLRQEVE